ncbi:hypothetical protein ACMU_10475 [Actibacterium mucosum KCTC 23349]|uniref:AsmA domain-containing protein n=1 Tax=Actibacterium mucosum KCTC 23349 TaxID=1454373 RepID=A0A037ZJ80_9RHOB|nr:AsmA family protein [Actibacterium mucosum]KAJ56168.1 hypothetical protein ACMU_10475 [Actibacterium mucosum KCTC 23349]
MRWLIRIFFALVLLVVLLVGGLFLLPADKIGDLVSNQVEKATGRHLAMSGRLVPSVWPEPGLRTGAVSLSNADWASDAPMLRAEGLTVGLDMQALLGGQVKLREITILSPDIVLERHSDGRANWVLAPETAPTQASEGTQSSAQATPAAPPTIETLTIRDGRLRFVDHGTGQALDLQNVTLNLAAPDPGQPVAVDLSGRLRGQDFAASTKLGALAALMAGQVSPVSFDFAAGDARIAFDGRAGLAPLAATGALEVDVSDLAPLFALSGTTPPNLPAGFGQAVKLNTQLTLAPEGSAHLRELVVQVDGNRVTGALDLMPGDRPRLVGRLDGGPLNLAALTPAAQHSTGASGDATVANTPQGWPKTPIDIAPLALMEMELAVTADSVDFGQTSLGRLNSLITLTDRRLVVDIRDLRAFDGQITGNFVMNGRGSLSVGGDLTARGIGLQPLLSTAGDFDRLTGAADMSLDFLGVGGNVDAIMHSLKGNMSLALGPGVLSGINVRERWRNPDGTPQSNTQTVFNGATATFRIENGVARTNDFQVASDRLSATGKGDIALGPQTLDMLLTPRTVAQTEGQGALVLPLKIRGPWSGPKLSVDIDEFAKEQWKAQNAERREEAEERVRDEISRALGVDREEGETVEDAVRRELREKAREELLKRLKKN